MLKITAGSTHIELAKQLSASLAIDYVAADIQKFADGEFRIRLKDLYEGDDVVIVQSTHISAHENLVELLFLAHAAKAAGANKITALITYLAYSRQDRSFNGANLIPAQLIAKLLEAAGITEIITVDLHSDQLQSFFNIKIRNIESLNIFAPYLNLSNLIAKNLVIISPDSGGINRAEKFAVHLGVNTAIMHKIRTIPNQCHMSQLVGEVANKDCLIIDDIIDTANTLCRAAELLLANGARSVSACITHAVLSRDAISRIINSQIAQIIITNTIPHDDLPAKFKTVSLHPALLVSLSSL